MARSLRMETAAAAALAIGASGATGANFTGILSVSTSLAHGNGPSGAVALASEGQLGAFASRATNLVEGDTNGAADIFVIDRAMLSGTTRVSVASGAGGAGAQANGASDRPAISAGGRRVAFDSIATNLVAGDTNDASDVFLHDRQTGQTTRISVSAGAAQGDGPSLGAAISDGSIVAFESFATNLVAGDTNTVRDVFVRDPDANQTTRVSVGAGGAQANAESFHASVSGDGRFVVFASDASNLVAGDTNNASDVFLHDRQAGLTTRLSLASGGAGAQGDQQSFGCVISRDARLVAFTSLATNLVEGDTNGAADVFLRDLQTNTTTRISVASGAGGAQGDGPSQFPSLAADGRLVAFSSAATNLVAGDTNATADVFVRDRVAATTTRASVSTAGAQANGASVRPSIAPGQALIAFESDATNLVMGDTNAASDVFVHGPCFGDADADGFVGFADLNIILGQFGQNGAGLQGDLNGDGTVNFADLNTVLSFFGVTC